MRFSVNTAEQGSYQAKRWMWRVSPRGSWISGWGVMVTRMALNVAEEGRVAGVAVGNTLRFKVFDHDGRDNASGLVMTTTGGSNVHSTRPSRSSCRSAVPVIRRFICHSSANPTT